MTVIGTIPKEIHYVVHPKETVVLKYKHMDEEFENTLDYHPTKVYDNANDFNVQAKPLGSKLETKNNVPLTDLQILDSVPGSFGTHYMVLINNNQVIDIKDELLIDIIRNSEITNNGVVSGQFIWAKIAGHLKLIRVGSQLHSDVQDSHNKKFNPKIKNSQFEIGGIYRSRNGTTQVFLGNVRSTIYYLKYTNNSHALFDYNVDYDKQYMFFAEITRWNNKKNKKLSDLIGDDWNINENNSLVRYDLKRSHSFIEKLGNIEVPENMISEVRTMYKSKVAKYLGSVDMKAAHGVNAPMYSSSRISGDSMFLNMYAVGSEKVKLFDVNQYLMLS